MTGFVYFLKPVGVAGPIKIGHSQNPNRRLSDLQPCSPCKLEMLVLVPGSQKLEIRVQNFFAEHHSHHEWFHPSDELVSLIKNLSLGASLESCIDLSTAKVSLRAHYGRRRDHVHLSAFIEGVAA